MARENRFRDKGLESWIKSQPDALLHATTPNGVRPPKISGPKPYSDKALIDICLNCPLDECLLETNRRCKRYREEVLKIREARKNEAENREYEDH